MHAPSQIAVAPLSVPIFRAVWISSLISNFGGLIQSVGASWMMLSLSHSPATVALVSSCTTLPIMLLSLPAGAIADGGDRRVVMIWAQAFMLIVSAVLSLFAWASLLTPVLLLAFTFLIGCGTALNGPAWQASVGDMVPRPALPGAVAMNAMGFNIARSLGPALGGAIVAAAGAAAAFFANAVSYIGLIVVLARWRPVRAATLLPREPLGEAIGAGVRYVAMSPGIRVVLVRAAVFGLGASAVPALLPLVARHLVSGGALTYGLLRGAFGVGAVGGALGGGALRRRLTGEQIARAATLAIALGSGLAGVSSTLVVTVPALLLAGAGWVLALSTFNVAVQLSSPRWVVARALALYQMAAFGGMAAGSAIFGAIAEASGAGIALQCAAAALLGATALSLSLPLAEAQDLDLSPLERWVEPQTALAVERRGGPIVITIQYRLASSDIEAFLETMVERRRIRIRDGARQWALLRDLGDAELWLERYKVATWVEYVRHNQRRTRADAAVSERLLALHRGPGEVVVQRRIEWRAGSVASGDSNLLAEPLTDPTRSS